MSPKAIQTILFEGYSGCIVKSSGAIFSVTAVGKQSLYDFFPMLESLVETFANTSKAVYIGCIPRVESSSKLLNGIYDFCFEAVRRGKKICIQWTIEDRTNQYQAQRSLQQARQEQIVARQSNTIYQRERVY